MKLYKFDYTSTLLHYPHVSSTRSFMLAILAGNTTNETSTFAGVDTSLEAEKNSTSTLDTIVESVSRTGGIKVRFTQVMHVPQNWTEIPEQVDNGTYNETCENYLELEVENNSNVDEDLLEIESCTITNFTQTRMTLQVNFSSPEYISYDSLSKDRLFVKVLHSNVFVTKDALDSLAQNYTFGGREIPQQIS